MATTTNIMPMAGLEAGSESAKSVLIVDDEESARNALADVIGIMRKGLTIYTAENGRQAVAILKNVPVDLVITDLRMPGMDGMELTLWMQENRAKTPVIVVSAYAEFDTVMNLEMEGHSFLDKPLNLAELAGTVRNLLS